MLRSACWWDGLPWAGASFNEVRGAADRSSASLVGTDLPTVRRGPPQPPVRQLACARMRVACEAKADRRLRSKLLAVNTFLTPTGVRAACAATSSTAA